MDFREQKNYIESTPQVKFCVKIFLKEDPAILELGVVTDMDNNKYIETANQIQNVVQRIPRKYETKNYIEELDEKEISTKKKKQVGPTPNSIQTPFSSVFVSEKILGLKKCWVQKNFGEKKFSSK